MSMKPTSLGWGPSKGPQTPPRWSAASKARRLPTLFRVARGVPALASRETPRERQRAPRGFPQGAHGQGGPHLDAAVEQALCRLDRRPAPQPTRRATRTLHAAPAASIWSASTRWPRRGAHHARTDGRPRASPPSRCATPEARRHLRLRAGERSRRGGRARRRRGDKAFRAPAGRRGPSSNPSRGYRRIARSSG